jgi:PhnB protein
MSDSSSAYPLLSPYLAVREASQAIEFYTAAFGACERFRLTDPNSGKVGHAEMIVNGSLVMLSDEYPGHNTAPATLGGSPVTFSLMVDDVDAWVERARAAGAIIKMEPQNTFYGHRSAVIVDPFGHQWMVQREVEKVSTAEMQRRWNDACKPKKA